MGAVDSENTSQARSPRMHTYRQLGDFRGERVCGPVIVGNVAMRWVRSPNLLRVHASNLLLP